MPKKINNVGLATGFQEREWGKYGSGDNRQDNLNSPSGSKQIIDSDIT